MKNDKLDDFKTWLIHEKFLGQGSTKVYASRVKKLLEKTEGNPTTDNLDRVLSQPWCSSSLDSFYTSWAKFVEYGKNKGISIAAPTKRWEKRRQRKIAQFPDLIADSLLEIIDISGMPASMIPFIRWKDIRSKAMNGVWEAWDDRNPGSYYCLPVKQAAAVFDWSAGGRPIPMTPLVPKKTGSIEPMPLAQLRRLLSIRKRSR